MDRLNKMAILSQIPFTRCIITPNQRALSGCFFSSAAFTNDLKMSFNFLFQ